MSGLEVISASTPPISGFGLLFQSVSCPPGKTALGGGVRFTDATGATKDGMVMASLPTSPFPPTGWYAVGSNQYTTTGGAGTGNIMTVYAICAVVAP